MRERHITIGTSAGSPRTKRFVIGSLGIVLTVTATSGIAVATRSSNGSNTSKQTHTVQASHTSNDTSATHNSSTTVSINGQTIQVNGDGSYNRVYQSDDGTAKVNISVHNSSSSRSGETMD